MVVLAEHCGGRDPSWNPLLKSIWLWASYLTSLSFLICKMGKDSMPDKREDIKVKAGVFYQRVSMSPGFPGFPGHKDNLLESPVQLGAWLGRTLRKLRSSPGLCSGQAHDCFPLALTFLVCDSFRVASFAVQGICVDPSSACVPYRWSDREHHWFLDQQ